MKVFHKEVNPRLTKELKAYLRHQAICRLALYNHDLDGLEPAATEREKAEHARIRKYISAENEKARKEGYKINWTLPVDDDVFTAFNTKHNSAL